MSSIVLMGAVTRVRAGKRGPRARCFDDPVAGQVVVRSLLVRTSPKPVKPDRLYSLFKEGYRMQPDEREILIQHLLEINVCDMRLFKNIHEFEQLQAERGTERRSS